MPSCDVVIIGAGVNGLAAALRLARAGRSVIVVDRDAPGGPARTAEFHPGYRAALAHLWQGLDPRLGVTVPATPVATVVPGVQPLRMPTLTGRAEGLAPDDLAAWEEMRARLARFARVLAPFRAMTPPRIKGSNDLFALSKIGLSVRAMGAADFRELLRVALINVADLLEDDLTDQRLMGLCAFDATLGAWMGPRSPNSLLGWLNRIAAGDQLTYPKGGLAAVTDALGAAVTGAGGRIIAGDAVARIDVAGDRAVGVTLASGENVAAGTVLSAIAPQATFALVPPDHRDTGMIRAVRAIRSRGAAAKLHLALTGAPVFAGAALTDRIVLAPSVNAVETAWNPAKYGEVPDRPVMEVTFPSAHDATLAPAGGHVLSAIVQFAPHAPKDPEVTRATLLANAMAVLEEAAPGLGALVAHAELLLPQDIEAQYGLEGGNWHQAELSVEQMLFLRPFHGAAQYRTPIPGLWLGGAGSHPGGGINGTAGWNAATAFLENRA
jgi:phytoene dehydrogenase-like protein